MKLTMLDVKEYQNRMLEVKESGFKAKDFKKLGRELRDKFNLTDIDAINILNNNHEEIFKILLKQEEL